MNFFRGIQEEEDNYVSNCLTTFAKYNERFDYVKGYTGTSTMYDLGRADKGNGEATVAGYYMEMVTLYLDITVLMTNLYIDCDIDYFMQRVGKSVVSLSGFLDLMTNFLFRFFGTDDTGLYTDLSTAIDAVDAPAVGLNMGRFVKIFLAESIPSQTVSILTERYETVRVD